MYAIYDIWGSESDGVSNSVLLGDDITHQTTECGYTEDQNTNEQHMTLSFLIHEYIWT
jgi:hypothetical protein